MKKKPTKKAKKVKKKPVVETPQEEVEDLTKGEEFIGKMAPYASTIGLAIVAAFLGFLVIAFFMQGQFDKQAWEWRELTNSTTIAYNTGDLSGLKKVTEDYPTSKSGMWAAQIAGDYQLRTGLQQLPTDREGGLGLIKQAKEKFQTVVDAPATAKTTMLAQRSQFSLAYAHESLGEFDAAKALYEELLEEAPNSAFADVAKRGAERSGNADFADLYTKFVNYEEDVLGDAPGLPVESKPDVDFPEVDLPEGEKPKDDSEMVKSSVEGEKAADTENQEAEKVEADKGDADKAAEGTEPAKENAGQEKASEKEAAEESAGEAAKEEATKAEKEEDK